jgi:hypothetical protein
MRLYAGCDLHAKSNYRGIVDEKGKRVFKKKVGNDREQILEMLEWFRRDMEGVAVESAFNWYWLVDLLMEEGYGVYLANLTKMQKYSGLKYGDDEDDAFWLAEMLRLGILPVGHIYPKESRPIRDLLCKRVQTNAAVAHSALAYKLAWAAYYILRDGVRYDPQKLFGGSWAGAESLGGGQAKRI